MKGGRKAAEVIETISCKLRVFRRARLEHRILYWLGLSLWLDVLGRTSNTVDHRQPRIFDPCVMVSKKRNLEDGTSPKAKKSKLVAEASTDKKQKKVKAKVKADKPLVTTSNVVPEEIDFPRGGGTTFTPQEVKAIRAEAMTEADDLFKVRMQCVVPISPAYMRERNMSTRQRGYAKSRMPRVKARQTDANRKEKLFG